MEPTQTIDTSVLEKLARREQQLEQLRSAYLELQQQQQQPQQLPQQHNQLDRILKNVSYLPIFTGVGDITINSFLSSVEYLLSTIGEEGLKKEAIKAIYYRNIQREAKNVVINVHQPDNWIIIKKTLKLRYRPDVEPHQIYRRINELRVNNVSELAVELQNLKYKSDELSIYYQDDHCIDLTNVDSLLTNIAKEMTQGILLDKIYDERDLGTIIDTMTKRRYEDSCIRPEFRKFRGTLNRSQVNRYRNNNNNRNQFNTNYRYNNNMNNDNNRNTNGNMNNNNDNGNNNISGRYRIQNELGNNNTVGQFRQAGYPRPYSNQVRWNPNRQNRIEPMEIDNIEVNVCNPQVAGHPNRRFGQDRLNLDRQSQEGLEVNYCNPQVAGHPNRRFGQDRLNLDRQSREGLDINYGNSRVAGHPNHTVSQDRLIVDRQSPEGPRGSYEEEDNNMFFMRQPRNVCLK
ncbi:protein kinase 4-like [Calliphora vicina]|uniref:protein kinase 4-like n=1 Tax=Calliphora vicina TaxID=7373 RepID=UPI00325B3A33